MSQKDDIAQAAEYLQQGNYKRAAKAATLAVRKSPQSPVPLNLLGIALGASGKPTEAISQFKKALKLKPDYWDARKNLAQTYLVLSKPGDALPHLNTLAQAQAEDWQVWHMKAQCHHAMGQDEGALGAADQARKIAPDQPAILKFRSLIHLGSGRIRDAVDDLQNALEINPQDVDALTRLSQPLARLGRSDDALATVLRAVEIAPDNTTARVRLATQYVEMGDHSSAIPHYRSVLQIDPAHCDALERLSELLSDDECTSLEPQIRAALDKAPKQTEIRATLFYAMARVCTAKKDASGAQKNRELANREMARIYAYDPAIDTQITRDILGRFPVDFAASTAKQDGSTPIFVLGLPRTGTTLVEAVLGAHPQVAAFGELGTAGFLLRGLINENLPFDDAAKADFIVADRALLPDLPEGANAYIDKMPENYRLVGFLKGAYPGAKIINLTRDPRDTALSIWKAHFSGAALAYSYRLDWMAHKFNLFAEMMTHWHQVFPGEILDVAYEDLVTDPEEISKKLAAFCDLEWQAEMARPEANTAQILTLSATQLRQPVHTSSIGKWKTAGEFLTPFTDGLDPAFWPGLSP